MSDAQLTQGSSPRGRGKHYLTLPARPVNGLIPARAGKTVAWDASQQVQGAHPRAGGENTALTWADISSLGSSPRGRGKHGHVEDDAGQRRLIPARAGKTTRLSGQSTATWAHPRAGGENLAGVSEVWRKRGSSPRGRGKHAVLAGNSLATRLIPARAGKTPPT